MGQKNEDFSESLNSFDFGAIFPPRSGQDLSRNGFVVSIYAFERNPYGRIGFFLTPQMSKFHEIFGKTLAAELKVNFSGPAGGSAPGKVLRPQGEIPYDS